MSEVFKKQDTSFSQLQKNALYALIFIALLPVAFYALFLDHGVFVRGAQAWLSGGQLYRDYLDMKPPAIFYLYAAVEFLFPFSERALKTFDFLWQFATAISLVYIMRQYFSDATAFTAAIVYSTSYTALFFTGTMQCESFAAMPMLWLLHLHAEDRALKKHRIFAIGILAGILISLKFTLGIILLAVLLDDIIARRYTAINLFKKYIFISASSLLSLCILFYFLFNSETRSEYSLLAQYISAYASFPPFNFAFVERVFDKQSDLFFKEYSFTFFLSAVIGTGLFFKSSNKNTAQGRLLFTVILASALLWCTVVLERKFFPYHFSRLYIPLSILSGIGGTTLLKKIGWWWHSGNYSIRIALFLSIAFLFLASPLFHWLLYSRVPVAYFIDEARYNNFFQKANPQQPLSVRQQHLNIAHEINSKRLDNDEKVFVIGMEAARIGYFLKEYPISKFSTSQYYLGNGSPQKWKDEAFKEMQGASWLVAQTDDNQPLIFGHSLSSWEATQNDPQLSSCLHKNFVFFKTIGYYHIFKRRYL